MASFYRPKKCVLSRIRLPRKDVPCDVVNFFVLDEKCEEKDGNLSGCYMIPLSTSCCNLVDAELVVKKKFPTATAVTFQIQTVQDFLAFAYDNKLQVTHDSCCERIKKTTQQINCTCFDPSDISWLCLRIMPELHENEKSDITHLHPTEQILLTRALNQTRHWYCDGSLLHYNMNYWIVFNKKFTQIYRASQISFHKRKSSGDYFCEKSASTTINYNSEDEDSVPRMKEAIISSDMPQKEYICATLSGIEEPELDQNYVLGTDFCLSKLPPTVLQNLYPSVKFIPLHMKNCSLQFSDVKMSGGKCPKTEDCGLFRFRASLGQLHIFSESNDVSSLQTVYVFFITPTKVILVTDGITLRSVCEDPIEWDDLPYVLN